MSERLSVTSNRRVEKDLHPGRVVDTIQSMALGQAGRRHKIAYGRVNARLVSSFIVV